MVFYYFIYIFSTFAKSEWKIDMRTEKMTPCVAGYEGTACSSFKYSNENPE